MNIVTQYVDKYAAISAVNQKLYESLLLAVGEDNEGYIICMKPSCHDHAEVAYRRWLGIITLSAIIHNSVTVGAEDIEDVLEANQFCTC